MKHERLHALTDGIFAIVMTILVLEIKVPELHGEISNAALWEALREHGVVFLSYILSFTVLYTYWRAHTFIISIIAQNLNIWLVNINALFLLCVGLLPFSAHVLGLYHSTQLGISVYAINIIMIGLSLFAMRRYVETSKDITATKVNPIEQRNGYVRIFLPIVIAIFAIGVSFINTGLAILLLTIAVVFNLLPNNSVLLMGIVKKV